MPNQIVLVEQKRDWHKDYPNVQVVAAKDYISDPQYFKLKDAKIINLCRSYRYLSIGYYCSLLAEARKHKIIPTVKTIINLSTKSIYSLNIEDLDVEVHKILDKAANGKSRTEHEIHISFGTCDQPEFSELARQLFEMFPCPLLRVEFELDGKWNIASIKSFGLHHLEDYQRAFFINSFQAYAKKRWYQPRTKKANRFDLAILHNPKEVLPPSDARTLKKFIQIGKKSGINVELIEKRDYSSLLEYDGLFIRETTQIDHYTYRFSRRAEKEGMAVIDDPESIVKCTNKVYLSELLNAHHIPILRTLILKKSDLENLNQIESQIQYPVVLKIPDSSFSRGVFKATTSQELLQIANDLFEDSDLILAQEFMFTEFDWRIGVLNRKPLFACLYFMSKKHWQIVKRTASGHYEAGIFKTIPIEAVPAEVINIALKGANLIGNGLYGVDLKQVGNKVYIIEINDNPNIDAGVEDQIAGDALYQAVIDEFIRRIELLKSRQ